MKRKSSGVYQNFQQLDIKLYQAYRSIKELTKIQKRFLLCLLILYSIFLVGFVNSLVENNMAWLNGSWSNESYKYIIKAKDERCMYWDVKQGNDYLMKEAQIAVNSSKKDVILTRDGSSFEYHFIRLDKSRLELQIFNNHEKLKSLELKKVN